MSRARTLTVTAASVLAAVVLAGCGGSGGTSKDDLGAAEPATSPELSGKPDGTVAKIGAAPQGIVYDAATDQLAVAVRKPYRLLVVDPRTYAVKRSVEVPGKVRHLQVSSPGGDVLVPSETANTLYQVPLTANGKVLSTKVPEHPHDATAGDGYVISGDEFAGSITFIKGDQVVKTLSDLKQPGGVVADNDGHAIAVDVGDFTVTSYDTRTLTRTKRLPAGEGPTHGVLTGNGKLAVTDTRGDHLILYSVDPLKQTDSIDVPGSPYGLTADTQSHIVWTTLTGKNKVVGYDVSGDTPRKVAEYDTVRQPDTVAVSPGSKTLWITGTDDGVIQRIDR
ncbi:hypothetical protein GCM10011519_32310 [Marmoricola endophyticus]|uniref:YncE family protein n=1 Tax=Marmoricola endophyticus TaxID=2040280 RepID=A0A917F873_9ACTN|nr:YncE family protein [Marmoricola endophyticus]GGF55944.1 hypothetical protein GCM10011519_32310 [Marmoricola endophyticus]